MDEALSERSPARCLRKERLYDHFPPAKRILENSAKARRFLVSARFARVAIGHGVFPDPDFGLANHDAVINLVKDALGYVRLSDAEFENALSLAEPPARWKVPE